MGRHWDSNPRSRGYAWLVLPTEPVERPFCCSCFSPSPINDFRAIPVLFIPGSNGHPKQVRSLGSIAAQMALDRSANFTFEHFVLDFFEVTPPSFAIIILLLLLHRTPLPCLQKSLNARPVSVLFARLLIRVDCVVQVIPFIHKIYARRRLPMTIIGHSMVIGIRMSYFVLHRAALLLIMRWRETHSTRQWSIL